MSKEYHLFISHSWSYGDAYDRLEEMLKEHPYFRYKDHSVPKHDPIHNAPTSHALYIAIKNQIAGCNIIIIMAGKYATFSEWINKEIKISKTEFSFPKPILAVKPWGATQISSVVRKNADLEVGWNSNAIVNGIRQIAF